MKKVILFLCTLCFAYTIYAQDIFKKHGFDKEALTLSKGRYEEVFTNEEVVQIGSVLLNTKTNKIVKFLSNETDETSFKSEHSSRWLSPDPLAEKFPWQSPYVYCSNNPVNKIDPDGKADFWYNGKIIGNDGVDDKRILAIRTESLTKESVNETVKYVKANSGKTEAFLNNGMAYTNSIAIESSADNRQAMVMEVSKDNGKGGVADANNREYGGSIQDGVVITATPGAVANPKTDATANIDLPTGVSTFHSHPSGTIVDAPPAGTIGGTTTTYSFIQPPSSQDITNAGSHTSYVFGRNKSSNNVYIYNSSGLQAIIPMKRFVNPKK